ncbi:MAG: tetratricopeptide repeat protein [Deltaproteobacteria bacterium]|nr:tetratricopeptide repeat protein [Deltaproteobacteria bacterium]
MSVGKHSAKGRGQIRTLPSVWRVTFIIFFLFVFRYALCATPLCFAASATASIKEGNSLYHQEKYDEALKHYNEAVISKPDSDVINFDIGTALYQKQDYEKAIEAFNKALLSDNHKIEQKAAYNIGNCKYRLGALKMNTDLASAVRLYREALDYYKRSIELNQKNTNAKYNHEFVEKELKILLDKLKQQKEKGQQGNQQKQQQAQKQQGAEQGEEKKEQQKGEGLKPSEGHKREQNAQKEMSEEEARMILDRYNQQDQSVANMDRNLRDRRYPRVLKDW